MTSVLTEEILTEFDNLEAFLQGLQQATVVAVDTETTGLEVSRGKDYLQGVSVAYRTPFGILKEYFPFRHNEGHNLGRQYFFRLVEILGTKQLVWCNRKFDLHSLSSMGGVLPAGFFEVVNNPHYDCLILAHLINENYPMKKDMASVAKMYLKRESHKDQMQKFTDTFGWGNVPSNLMAPYAKEDAEVTLLLWEILWPRFKRMYGDKAEEYNAYEMKKNNVLYRMEAEGVDVDLHFCKIYEGISQLEMMEIERELGFEPSKSTQLSKWLFETMKLPVLEYTPGGKPSLNKNVMEEYERMLEHMAESEEDQGARLVLNYRGWQKALGTFYRPFQTLADSQGKIHCSFRQNRTVTGRLSCSEPNLQQIPRTSDKPWNGKIRGAFHCPDPEWVHIGFDYSQLELRLAAAYGEEADLIEEFGRPDADPFTRYAEIIGVDRYTTKTFFYAMIYGAGKDRIARTLKRSLSDIEAPYNAFVASIPGIIAVKKRTEKIAAQRGYIRYWTGRQRHFRNRDESYKSFNSLLQGGGAEVVSTVMIDVDRDVCDDNCRLVLQVHDELLFKVRKAMVDTYAPQIVECMQALPTNVFNLPFLVSGKQWGEVE